MDSLSELGKSNQIGLDCYAGRMISNNKDMVHVLRVAKSAVREKSPEKLSPRVVLPNLNFITQERASQIRVPFAKVNPLTVPPSSVETVSDYMPGRRNATRSCRKAESVTSESTKLETKKLHPRSLPVPKVSSGKQRSRPQPPTVFHDPSPCTYCKKLFTCEEFAQEHEQYCESSTASTSLKYLRPIEVDDTMNKSPCKLNFLNLLGLRTLDSEAEVTSVEQSGKGNPTCTLQGVKVNSKSGRSRKCQLTSFFRSNPVPLSSNLGKKFALESNLGVCENPGQAVQKYEQFCVPQMNRLYMKENRRKWPTTVSRKMKFKKGHFVHQFSFSRTQRLTRYVEITLGLNMRACRLLNNCRDVSVCVKRLSERDSIKYRWKQHIYNQLRLEYQTSSAPGRKKLHPSCLKIFPMVEIVGLENTPEGLEFLQKKNLLFQTN
jgi:hypothetical protein